MSSKNQEINIYSNSLNEFEYYKQYNEKLTINDYNRIVEYLTNIIKYSYQIDKYLNINCDNCVDCYLCIKCNDCNNCYKCQCCENCEKCFNCFRCNNVNYGKNIKNKNDLDVGFNQAVIANKLINNTTISIKAKVDMLEKSGLNLNEWTVNSTGIVKK